MGRKPSPTKMPGRAAIFVALCSRTRPARPYVPFVVDGHFTSIFTFFFLFYNFHRVECMEDQPTYLGVLYMSLFFLKMHV